VQRCARNAALLLAKAVLRNSFRSRRTLSMGTGVAAFRCNQKSPTRKHYFFEQKKPHP
jgi:hypothetical protein